ncbi:MAG: hypothetical protein ACI8UP_002282 [Porticoccaceae bacterium]|jgi:hypothetical protein
MAINKTVHTAKLAIAVSLATLMTACAGNGPDPLMATSPDLVDRFGQNGLQVDEFSDNIARAYIDPALLRSDAPVDYTIIRGDTLWDIAGRYLNKPWMWTSIWEANQQIRDPNLIFPGDKLELEYIDGLPTILLSQNGIATAGGEPQLGASNASQALDEHGNSIAIYSNSRVKLGPIIRAKSLDAAIPTIAGDSIQQFLIHPLVVDIETLNTAPYVVANQDNRLISSVGSQIYARGQINRRQINYGIYRKSDELRDPDTGVLLGHEITHVADAKLLNLGDPSTLMITSNKMETTSGDILLSSSVGEASHQYVPRIPKLNGEGRIISLFNAISQTGRDQVVVLNVGKSGNIKTGDVLAIESKGRQVVDKFVKYGPNHVKLPNVRTGVVMVFKTFEKVSYALVMESTRPVRINDIITGI